MTSPATGSGSDARGEILKVPTADEVSQSRVGKFVQWLGAERGRQFDDYTSLWQWSVDDLPDFWESIWDYFGVVAQCQPAAVLPDRRMPGAAWFPGARLNYAENILRGPDDDVVVIALSQTRERLSFTRSELRDLVARARTGLHELGVRPGDRVAGYLPNIPETLIAMLATASLGAVWAACSPEFGTPTVLDRFQQIDPTVLIAVNGYTYGAKAVDRSEAVATIARGLPSLRATIGVDYLRDHPAVGDTNWTELIDHRPEFHYTPVAFEHPLWILFSSGTTGLPKAITHSHGGIVVELLKSHALQSDLGPSDTYFVYCTTSWVMWNLLVSALLVGSAVVLMDGNPTYPDALQLWRITAEEQVTVLGCGASLLVQAAKDGLSPKAQFDLSRLRGVTSTGSPLPADTFRWVFDHVGHDIYLQSSSGGTDVCSGFVGGSPMLPVRAGEIAGRCLGVDVAALDPDGRTLNGTPGEMVIKAPMPSMPVGLWNDPDGHRFHDAYFSTYPGLWRQGDWIVIHDDGSCRVLGRSDGTLNRGGVRLGTSEFYSVLDRFESISDSLVVHLDDPAGGLGRLILFVQLTEGCELDDSLRRAIAAELRSAVSPRHQPDEIRSVPEIPYGLTGKKLEIPIKRLLQGAPLSSVVSEGAVRNPQAFNAFATFA